MLSHHLHSRSVRYLLFCSDRLFALAHHLFGQLGRHIEIKDERRLGQAQKAVFKAEKPVEIFLPLAVRQLAGLMHSVRGCVAVSDQKSTRLVIFAPVLLVGRVAVDGVKRRRRVGVHIARVSTERAAEVQLDERGGLFPIAGKVELAAVDTLALQCSMSMNGSSLRPRIKS